MLRICADERQVRRGRDRGLGGAQGRGEVAGERSTAAFVERVTPRTGPGRQIRRRSFCQSPLGWRNRAGPRARPRANVRGSNTHHAACTSPVHCSLSPHATAFGAELQFFRRSEHSRAEPQFFGAQNCIWPEVRIGRGGPVESGAVRGLPGRAVAPWRGDRHRIHRGLRPAPGGRARPPRSVGA